MSQNKEDKDKTKENSNIVMAERIAGAVAEAGGRVFYVGGFVRDLLREKENTDVDIEVHGVSFRTLEEILNRFGERKVMGASFGIFGLKHCDLDIAMPRQEKANGRGHKDFEVYVDPFIGPEKAARRRDFTINAMMQDVLTGEILDFYGGQEDLKAGIIRHVNDATFVEDPLRVLRAAQFAARFGFRIADNTGELCRTMDLSALSKERIMGELEKALLKAEKPSVFFEELRIVDQLDFWFPELSAMLKPTGNGEQTEQPDRWKRTMRVLDAAAALRSEAKEPLWFMLSALCLYMEVSPAETLLTRLSDEIKQREYVLNMTELHGEPERLLSELYGEPDWQQTDLQGESGCLLTDSAADQELPFMLLFDRSVCPEDLLLLREAEQRGMNQPVGQDMELPGTDRSAESHGTDQSAEQYLHDLLVLYRKRTDEPCVMGKDLVAAGFRPGPDFKDVLQYAHALQLAGIKKEAALEKVLVKLRDIRGKNK